RHAASCPGGDRDDAAQAGHLHRQGRVGRGAVSELPGVVDSPGADASAPEGQRQAELSARRDGRHGSEVLHLDRSTDELCVALPAPACATAGLWLVPEAILVTPVSVPTPPGPLTWTGSCRVVVVPSPSCPEALAPQAQTVPSVFNARAWLELAPAAIEVTPSR